VSLYTAIIADAPQHYWRMADPGGVQAVNIGSASTKPPLDVTYGGLPYSGPSSDGGSAIRQDTNAQHVRNLVTSFPIVSPFSVEVWFYLSQIDGDSQVIETHEPTGGERMGMRVHLANPHTVLTYHTAGWNFSGSVGCAINTWHQLVTTYDHVDAKLYVDGSADGTQNVVFTPSTPARVFIGNDSANAGLCYGNFAELALFSTALSGAQVLAHWNAADTTSLRPAFKGGGFYPTADFGTAPLSDDLTAVLAAVRRTFPST
jgi:hypothetical protein